MDCFDIEVDERDPDKVRGRVAGTCTVTRCGVRLPGNNTPLATWHARCTAPLAQLADIVCALEPTFGGINLEDIKVCGCAGQHRNSSSPGSFRALPVQAPECFKVEAACKERMNIPVFHDDQHGTAVVTGAALLNALHLQGKELGDVKVVCIGAGASAVACMSLWVSLGVQRSNITMLDSAGVIKHGRSSGSWNEYKEQFAQPAADTRASLEDALVGADVVIGLSSGGKIPEPAIKTMAPKPVIFALANPDPEIAYDRAKELTGGEAIVATGRSDTPNQCNNVLCFPMLFRGALDCRAAGITEDMKVAAAHAIADLARQDVPDFVKKAYGDEGLSFGPDYILPKAFDSRLLPWVASRVARIAGETGTAKAPIADLDAYEVELAALAQRLAEEHA